MEELIYQADQVLKDYERSIIPKRARLLRYGANIAFAGLTGLGFGVGAKLAYDHTVSYAQMEHQISVDKRIATSRDNELTHYLSEIGKEAGVQCLNALTPYIGNGTLAYESLPTNLSVI